MLSLVWADDRLDTRTTSSHQMGVCKDAAALLDTGGSSKPHMEEIVFLLQAQGDLTIYPVRGFNRINKTGEILFPQTILGV